MPRPPGVMPTLLRTFDPANASSTAPHGIGRPTAAKHSARHRASSSQLTPDRRPAVTHVVTEGRTYVSERADSQKPVVSLPTRSPTRPRWVSIQSSPPTRSSGYRNTMAAAAEPATTTARIGSRMGSAPPPAITAPASATPASAQNAIAPDASSLQTATAVSAPKRRYLVYE